MGTSKTPERRGTSGRSGRKGGAERPHGDEAVDQTMEEVGHEAATGAAASTGDELDRSRSDELFAMLPDEAARDELVAVSYPLAEYLARRFGGRGEPYDDLVQVASIGLIKAIDRFEPERGVKFSTYATATIVGELKRHFRDKGWALRVPRRLQETSLRVSKVVSDLYQDFGRSPTVKEIAEHAGLSEEEVLEGMDTVHAYSVASLDAPADDEGTPAAADLGAEDETFEILEGWASISPLLRQLAQRERRILYLRFFQGLSQTQIAEELGMSQMHVSRLLARTIRQLRESVGGRQG
jgi:RNA polymerase sigma-B factor